MGHRPHLLYLCFLRLGKDTKLADFFYYHICKLPYSHNIRLICSLLNLQEQIT